METEGQVIEEGTYLPAEFLGVSILALRMSSRRKLGMYLNMIDALPMQCGLLPNYQGLAELIGFEFLEQKHFERTKDPTDSVLQEWGNRPEFQPTIGKLVEYLGKLKREDVLEDCQENIRLDAEHYLRRLAERAEIHPLQDATVSQSPYNIDDMQVDETAIMTIQDVESGEPTYYDAFVCYHPEGEDLKFVKTMIERMECEPHKLKLFVPHRDDLPGASKHVISAKLIQDRCKRMVIIMSPRYLQSDACDFQTKFAHALSPGSRSKKLVPVLVHWCETPNILRHVTICDFTRGDMTGWFWQRLISSLKAPLSPTEIEIDHPNSLTGLEMKVQSDSTSANFSMNFASATACRPPQPPHTQPVADVCGGRNSPLPRDTSASISTDFPHRASGSTDPVSKTSIAFVASSGAKPSPSASCPVISRSSSPSHEQKVKKKESGLKKLMSAVFSSSHGHSSS